jgi:hypothetical protein
MVRHRLWCLRMYVTRVMSHCFAHQARMRRPATDAIPVPSAEHVQVSVFQQRASHAGRGVQVAQAGVAHAQLARPTCVPCSEVPRAEVRGCIGAHAFRMHLTAATCAMQRAVDQSDSRDVNAGGGSLLHKLLRSEIRRERSHLLQAFRFLSNAGYEAACASI